MAATAELAPPHAGLSYHYARHRFRRRTQALQAVWQYLAPGHGTCPRCRATVLIVGADVPLEPVPVLERFRCPQCEQVAAKGDRRRVVCWRCRGAGYVGEVLPARGWAIDPVGVARPFSGVREDGEAVHRLHVCVV